MFRRQAPLRAPVTITLDGEALPAERGEPLAMALLACDKTILARSPKLHRPRAPSCFRGACDGCLARVDGVPNVMTCLRPAVGGERIESQNVVGSRRADLLRVTDWFFPNGIDHHHFMAGIPGLSDVMQSFARKVAGLGKLPAEAAPPSAAHACEVDVAVVGGGVAGITAASCAAAASLRVLLIDDGIELGGAALGAPRLVAETLALHPLPSSVTVLTHSVAAGSYDGRLLVVCGDAEALLVRARAVVFATGAHDGTLLVPNNDLPGVFSARAFCRVLAAGVEPDGPVAIVGDGFWADETRRALGDRGALDFEAADLVSVRGTGGVHGVEVQKGDGTQQHHVVAVALALPGAPAFELAEQAGAGVRFDPAKGYAVVTGERGRVSETVWAAGECTGMSFDAAALRDEAAAVAADVVQSLR